MKQTKHATTNFKMVFPYLVKVNKSEGYYKFKSGGYMPLTIEALYYDFKGLPVYSMTHYGEQNGDLMADPDMTFAVDFRNCTIEPLTFRNDYMGMYQEVYTNGGESYYPHLRTDLDGFLWQWLKNIGQQGFTPEL